MKYIVFSLLCIFLMSGCGYNTELIGISKEDPRLEFETFAKGFTEVERKNFISRKSGYDEGVIIDSQEDFRQLEENLGIDFDQEVDFDEYMLFANYEGNIGFEFKVKSFDITEIAYNDTLLQVKISYENSETVEAKQGEWICFYNISKIKKSDFPYEPRDFQSIRDKNDNKT